MRPFPDLLRQVMFQRRFTQLSLAKRVGIPVSFLHKVLNQERRVPSQRVLDLADALGLTGKARDEFIDAGLFQRLDPVTRQWITDRWGMSSWAMVAAAARPPRSPRSGKTQRSSLR